MSCCRGKKNQRMPSAYQQVKNFALSVANVMSHAKATGKVLADASSVASRVGVCNKCRHLTDGRCSVCGCFIALKAGLLAESCPLRKW